MATVKFYIRSKKNPTNIYLRLTIDRDNYFRRKTNYLVNPDSWNSKKGAITGRDVEFKQLNIDLEKLAIEIQEKYNKAKGEKVDVTNDWLQDEIENFLGTKKKTDTDRLTNYIQQYVEDLPYKVSKDGKKVGVARGTIQKYATLKNKIAAFEKYKKKRFYVKDVDLKFRKEIGRYFLEVDKLSGNSTGRYIKFLKTVCLDAGINGIAVNTQLKKIKGYTVPTAKVFLTFDELEIIENKTFERSALENAKDWLILGCYVGQRVGDLLILRSENIKVRNGVELIELTQKKTGKRVAIPLHPKVKEILDKRNGEFPDKISAQKFNKHIKDVAKIAGINELTEGGKITVDNEGEKWRKEFGTFPKWQLVSSHICRRSYASNFFGEIPSDLLRKITGHSTEKIFLEYVGKSEIDTALLVGEYYAKLALQAKKEPQMTVLKKAN